MVVSPTKKWVFPHENVNPAAQKLADELNISPLLGQLLLDRDVRTFEEARTFFRPQLDHLHDPFLMADMQKAVLRVQAALEEGQRIMVYGDYDVDGTTSVAMLYAFLLELEADAIHYQPDRYKEGYGVSELGMRKAAEEGVQLIITLDCGVTAVESIALANSLGMDVIVCDHHMPGNSLPEALAVLDPKRADCHYPYDGLSGCGVGFKLMQGLVQHMGWEQEKLMPYLDLLVISIGADIVPITGENRVLAHYGLQVLEENPRPGIKAMFKRAGYDKSFTNITDVVFTLAPRINAAGRIGHAELAVRLLLAKDEVEAEQLAGHIESSNATRKDLDRSITEEAASMVISEGLEDARSTVIWGEGWHKGVIGIVASRLIERYYRPTIVFSLNGDVAGGSVRSIAGINAFEILGRCKEHIIQFGGHPMAAGLSVKKENLEAFRQAFEAEVAKLTPEAVEEEVCIDAVVSLDEITPKFYRILKQFAPFGPHNMRPTFLSQGLVDAGFTRAVGADESHLKIHVCHEKGSRMQYNGIAFKRGPLAKELKAGQAFDIVYSLEENEWKGRKTLQLMVKDMRPSREG